MNYEKVLTKISLPVAVIIAAVIVGISFYAIQVNKQQSIERHQMRVLEQKQIVEEEKANQVQKEYAAKKKLDCLKIYEVENDKWSNVLGWRYEDSADACYIRYKEPKRKSDDACDKAYPLGNVDGFDWGYSFARDKLLCKEGEFENTL